MSTAYPNLNTHPTVPAPPSFISCSVKTFAQHLQQAPPAQEHHPLICRNLWYNRIRPYPATSWEGKNYIHCMQHEQPLLTHSTSFTANNVVTNTTVTPLSATTQCFSDDDGERWEKGRTKGRAQSRRQWRRVVYFRGDGAYPGCLMSGSIIDSINNINIRAAQRIPREHHTTQEGETLPECIHPQPQLSFLSPSQHPISQ